MFMILFLTLLAESYSLETTARPFTAVPAPDNGAYWVLAREDGQLPQVFFSGKTSSLVKLPQDTLFVCAASRGLVLVNRQSVRSFKYRNGALIPETTLHTFAQPLQRRHPWIWLSPINIGNKAHLSLVTEEHLQLVPLEQDVDPIVLPLPEHARDLSDPFLSPRTLAMDQWLYWYSGEKGIALHLSQQPAWQTFDPPKRRNMELASLLTLMGEQPVWLRYGGARGDLSSFGWQMNWADQSFKGRGLVTRFGPDPTAPSPNLFLLTVPASIGGQALKWLRGHTEYTVHQWLWQTSWRKQPAFDIKMSKPDRKGAPFMISWDGDFNKDGYADLLLADDKRGVRVHLSGANGRLATKGKPVADNPDALILCGDHLLLGKKQASQWRLEPRRVR